MALTGAAPSVLVLGGGGMLGHKMFQRLRQDHPDCFCTLRGAACDPPFDRIPWFQDGRVIERVDVLDQQRLLVLLTDIHPDVIVNCVGLIKQRPAASAVIPSLRINALLPHELAHLCATWGGRLIHFSTDCVFSGRRGGYTEDDVADAEDLYGRTKLLGEATSLPNAVTLRTSFIGRELSSHRSLLEWMLAQRGKTVRGFARVMYSGVTSIHLAGVVADLIARQPGLSGLYHVAGEAISKHDLLRLVREAYHLDVEILRDDRETRDMTLVGARFDAATGHRPPSWRQMLRELSSDSTPYEEWLTHETV